jgi:hypothetical protein
MGQLWDCQGTSLALQTGWDTLFNGVGAMAKVHPEYVDPGMK